MIRHWTLSAADLAATERRRRDPNQPGFALQLCAFRYPGRLLRPREVIPVAALAFVAVQLRVAPDAISEPSAESTDVSFHASRRSFLCSLPSGASGSGSNPISAGAIGCGRHACETGGQEDSAAPGGTEQRRAQSAEEQSEPGDGEIIEGVPLLEMVGHRLSKLGFSSTNAGTRQPIRGG